MTLERRLVEEADVFVEQAGLVSATDKFAKEAAAAQGAQAAVVAGFDTLLGRPTPFQRVSSAAINLNEAIYRASEAPARFNTQGINTNDQDYQTRLAIEYTNAVNANSEQTYQVIRENNRTNWLADSLIRAYYRTDDLRLALGTILIAGSVAGFIEGPNAARAMDLGIWSAFDGGINFGRRVWLSTTKRFIGDTDNSTPEQLRERAVSLEHARYTGDDDIDPTPLRIALRNRFSLDSMAAMIASRVFSPVNAMFGSDQIAEQRQTLRSVAENYEQFTLFADSLRTATISRAARYGLSALLAMGLLVNHTFIRPEDCGYREFPDFDTTVGAELGTTRVSSLDGIAAAEQFRRLGLGEYDKTNPRHTDAMEALKASTDPTVQQKIREGIADVLERKNPTIIRINKDLFQHPKRLQNPCPGDWDKVLDQAVRSTR